MTAWQHLPGCPLNWVGLVMGLVAASQPGIMRHMMNVVAQYVANTVRLFYLQAIQSWHLIACCCNQGPKASHHVNCDANALEHHLN